MYRKVRKGGKKKTRTWVMKRFVRFVLCIRPATIHRMITLNKRKKRKEYIASWGVTGRELYCTETPGCWIVSRTREGRSQKWQKRSIKSRRGRDHWCQRFRSLFFPLFDGWARCQSSMDKSQSYCCSFSHSFFFYTSIHFCCCWSQHWAPPPFCPYFQLDG